MTIQRSASVDAKQIQTHAQPDAKARRAVRKVLKPKNWADDVVGRPIENVEQIRESDRSARVETAAADPLPPPPAPQSPDLPPVPVKEPMPEPQPDLPPVPPEPVRR